MIHGRHFGGYTDLVMICVHFMLILNRISVPISVPPFPPLPLAMRTRRHLDPGGRIRRSARPARGSRRPRVVRWPRPGFGRQFRRDAEGFAIRRQLLSKLSADGAWLSHSPQNRALDIAESFLKDLSAGPLVGREFGGRSMHPAQ